MDIVETELRILLNDQVLIWVVTCFLKIWNDLSQFKTELVIWESKWNNFDADEIFIFSASVHGDRKLVEHVLELKMCYFGVDTQRIIENLNLYIVM